MFEEFNNKYEPILRAILKFYGEQEGIFCIKDLTKEMKVYRTEAVRFMNPHIKSGLLKPVESKEVRKILGVKDNRFIYYKIDLNHPLAHWWFDNKRAIAIEVLSKEIGDEAKPIIRKLKKNIKTKSIINELKNLKVL